MSFIIELIFSTKLMDSLLFNHAEDQTLTAQDNIPTAQDLTFQTQNTLPSLEAELQDSNIDSKFSDPEFVDTLDSAGVNCKIQVHKQI